MFSTITEAWNNNPVNEMTNKLNSSKRSAEQETDVDIYNFKTEKLVDKSDKHTNGILKHMIDQQPFRVDPEISESGTTSTVNLLSEDVSMIGKSKYMSYPSHRNSKKKKNKLRELSGSSGEYSSNPLSIDFSEFDDSPIGGVRGDLAMMDSASDTINLSTMSGTPTPTSYQNPHKIGDSRCSYSVTHLKKCDRCYNKLNRMINRMVKNRVDNLFIEANMKQLQLAAINNHANAQTQSPVPIASITPVPTGLFAMPTSDSWKETLIIIIGGIIAMLIIYLIAKCFK